MTTSSQPQYRFRVAICGCGIGGLGLAVMLSKYAPDIKVDIYEASTNPGEIGLGIAVTWRTSKIMDELGLRDDFESIGSPLDFSKLPKMALSKEDQEHGNPIPKNNKPEVRLVTLHRARLYSILFSRLGPNCTMHMSKRVVSYVQPGDANEPVTLLFADGQKETCDVLIGGDGIKSKVRATMVEELALLADAEGDAKGAASWRGFAKPSYTGILMYRMMYPGAKLEELSPNHPTLSDLTVFTGKGAGLVTYMVKLPAGRFGYMAVYNVKPELEGTPYSKPWITEGDAQEVVDCIAGWSQNAQDLGACVEGSVKKWAIHVVRGLPTFSYGRVAVIGDAAHSMTPFLGSGAGQALEDAYCLAKLFAHPSATRSTISQALKSYTQIRQPIAQQFVENSRQLGLLWTQSADKEYTLDELGAQCDAVTDIVAKGSPLEDAEKAVALFSTLIA